VAEKADIKVWSFVKLQGHVERYRLYPHDTEWLSAFCFLLTACCNLQSDVCRLLFTSNYQHLQSLYAPPMYRAERDAGFFSDIPELDLAADLPKLKPGQMLCVLADRWGRYNPVIKVIRVFS
jgi:hypothetical protein